MRQAKPRLAGRARHRTSEALSPPLALERLTEADIDLDRRVPVALVQRGREIEPWRPESGVVARTQAYAIKQGAAELRHRALVIAAGINERDDADGFGDLDAGFKIEHQARPSADRNIVGGEWSRH